MTSYFAAHALLPDGPARSIRFEIEHGRFADISPGADAADAVRLPGVVLPGLANCHSHAFHRALRGRTHGDGGTFWTWRERMYALAAGLDPERYLDLARATYAEMALAGITSVGEFHYLHHAAGGQQYADPNVMAEALRAAARAAGIRLTLLDTCYLTGGLDAGGHLPLDTVQKRFADADGTAWALRYEKLVPDDGFRVGAAVHSVRAVPREQLATVRLAAAGAPIHMHLSEQPAENAACLAHYGLTPTALLDAEGLLAPTATAVHATHLDAADVTRLGAAATTICMCPTTERDLADGIGPAGALADAGAGLSVGSDQHAVIDPFEEARAVELDERLATGRRGRFTPGDLLAALTNHASIGWDDAGRLAVGARADLVAVRLDSTRTAGSAAEQIMFTAGAADVDTVLVEGREIVRDGRHILGDVGRLLADAIDSVWRPW